MAHVLVVDDDEGTRQALRMALEMEGHTVDDAATARAAVAALLAASEPLVVLFDYVMPEQTGADFIGMAEDDVSCIERHAFICITASPARLPESLTTWLAGRSAPIVAKPFDLDALLEMVAHEAARLPVHASHESTRRKHSTPRRGGPA